MTASVFSNGRYPAALLSDMDGLLLDTEQFSKRSFDRVGEIYQVDNIAEIFPQLVGLNQQSHQQVLNKMLPPHIDMMEFDAKWKSIFNEMLEDDVPVKDGAVDLLKHLRAHHVPIAVVTSSQRQKAENHLARAGLEVFIDVVIGGDDVANGKPAPDIYLKGAARLGQPIADCLALEDSNNGVRAAYAAGAVVVQIPDVAPPSEDVLEMSCAITANLEEVFDVFGWVK